jgi:hypothetical protein
LVLLFTSRCHNYQQLAHVLEIETSKFVCAVQHLLLENPNTRPKPPPVPPGQFTPRSRPLIPLPQQGY